MTQTIRLSQNTVQENYNSADQSTDYERIKQSWVSNIFTLTSEVGGAGAKRDFQFVNNGTLRFPAFSSTSGAIQLSANTGTADCGVVGIAGSMNGSTNSQYGLKITPTFIQTGSAGYAALQIAVTETSTGSGAKLLISATVGGVSKFALDNTGTITFGDGGNFVAGTTTGTKLGTGATQKLGFWGATPVVRPAAVADATDAATVITQLNSLLAKLRTVGLIS
jgi:hypothetical protein